MPAHLLYELGGELSSLSAPPVCSAASGEVHRAPAVAHRPEDERMQRGVFCPERRARTLRVHVSSQYIRRGQRGRGYLAARARRPRSYSAHWRLQHPRARRIAGSARWRALGHPSRSITKGGLGRTPRARSPALACTHRPAARSAYVAGPLTRRRQVYRARARRMLPKESNMMVRM
jgi:hypothetical protein